LQCLSLYLEDGKMNALIPVKNEIFSKGHAPV
jgi:hypothetical protein